MPGAGASGHVLTRAHLLAHVLAHAHVLALAPYRPRPAGDNLRVSAHIVGASAVSVERGLGAAGYGRCLPC